MAEIREFKRSRLERKSEEQVTKKTVFLGVMTILLFIAVLVFGLPFLIRFSVFLGDLKNKKDTVVQETVLPPLAPRLILPFDATNSAKISIKGLSDANIDVELLKNDVSLQKTQASENGDFTFEDIQLDKGENVFTSVAINEQGGSSDVSKSLKVIFDDERPEILMINPSEESLNIDYSDFDIVGKSEKGVSVLINGRVAMVDDDGRFKLKFQLNAGKNDIEIIVRDLAGNETRKNISITYDI